MKKVRTPSLLSLLLLFSILSPAHSQGASISAPTNFTVTPNALGWHFSWNAVNGASSYRLYTRTSLMMGGSIRQMLIAEVLPKDTSIDIVAPSNSLVYSYYAFPAFVMSSVSKGIESTITPALVGCAPAYFVSARGTNQNPEDSSTQAYGYGLGEKGFQIWTQVRANLHLPVTRLPALAIPFTALGLPTPQDYTSAGLTTKDFFLHPSNILKFWGNMWGDVSTYNASVNLGVNLGQKLLLGIFKGCPSSKVMLFGFSQGAQIVGNIFWNMQLSNESHLVGVHLLADPLFKPSDLTPLNPTQGLKDSGILTVLMTRGPLSSVDKNIFRSWCKPTDRICQWTGPEFHGNYDLYVSAIVHEMTRQLQPQYSGNN